mgnify:CR=1 FL=1
MRYITIEGGTPLRGEVAVQGAKNSVLPILAATLLSGDVCRIEGCPHLSDVDSAADILRYLGCAVQWDGDDLLVDSTTLTRCDIPQTLMRRMRSSVIFLGAILARCGWAELSYPGGCELGPRPIDLHLAALRALGADNARPDLSPTMMLTGGKDAFLLCTDGFWEWVLEADMVACARGKTAQEWLNGMCALIAQRFDEEADNYSAIAIVAE